MKHDYSQKSMKKGRERRRSLAKGGKVRKNMLSGPSNLLTSTRKK